MKRSLALNAIAITVISAMTALAISANAGPSDAPPGASLGALVDCAPEETIMMIDTLWAAEAADDFSTPTDALSYYLTAEDTSLSAAQFVTEASSPGLSQMVLRGPDSALLAVAEAYQMREGGWLVTRLTACSSVFPEPTTEDETKVKSGA